MDLAFSGGGAKASTSAGGSTFSLDATGLSFKASTESSVSAGGRPMGDGRWRRRASRPLDALRDTGDPARAPGALVAGALP